MDERTFRAALAVTYAILLRPVANAIAGATVEAVDTGTLMALTGAYLPSTCAAIR